MPLAKTLASTNKAKGDDIPVSFCDKFYYLIS